MSNNPDACVPKVVTDFIFDLYESVTLSQIPDEQVKLYADFNDLNGKYFNSSPWPSPQSIASECNGHPLFLALYRELTHRQWTAVSRPSIRDRCDGWHVYRELFEEILEQDTFYILPQWCFDILHEFVYQFQGFCQVRAAVYASARKHGLLLTGGGDNSNPGVVDGSGSGVAPPTTSSTTTEGATTTAAATTTTTTPAPSATLVENWNALQSTDAWDVETVFHYLHRLIQIGKPPNDKPVVYTYLSAFASVALSRLECLLGDYTACLQVLESPLQEHFHTKIESERTLGQVVNSVLGARLSVAYHAGVSYLMLRRYKDAIHTLSDMCTGFAHLAAAATTGTAAPTHGRNFRDRGGDRDSGGNHNDKSVAAQQQAQLMKQYDRMICLLVILSHLTPNTIVTIADDATRRAIRDKTNKDNNFSWEEYFASPKFISVSVGTIQFHRVQVSLFLKEMHLHQPYRNLRSYLKLYTSLPLPKLASFYDRTVDQVLPLLLSFKSRMRQLELNSDNDNDNDEAHPASSSSSYKTAMDIHYYITDEMVHIDEPEKQRRFETHFFAQIVQLSDIAKQAAAIDVKVA